MLYSLHMQVFNAKTYFQNGEKITITESSFTRFPDVLVDHSHDFFEIAYIVDGVGEHILNNVVHTVKKGDIFFISQKSVHNYRALTADFYWVNCMFLPDAIDSSLINTTNAQDFINLTVLPQLNGIPRIGGNDIELYGAHEEFDDIFKNMLTECKQKKQGYQEALSGWLKLLFVKMLRVMSTDSYKSSRNNIVYQMLDYMKTNNITEANIKSIAEKSYLSPYYFSKLFKKQTGKSLKSYINESKIDKACSLLLTSQSKIIEIMRAVGYNDTKSFYQLFHALKGTTPNEYRRKAQEEQAEAATPLAGHKQPD